MVNNYNIHPTKHVWLGRMKIVIPTRIIIMTATTPTAISNNNKNDDYEYGSFRNIRSLYTVTIEPLLSYRWYYSNINYNKYKKLLLLLILRRNNNNNVSKPKSNRIPLLRTILQYYIYNEPPNETITIILDDHIIY